MTEKEILRFKELWSESRTCIETEWNYGKPSDPQYKTIEEEQAAEREFGDDIIDRILADLL